MVQPENVNPHNFKVQQVLYNDGDFSVAWGEWQDGNMRLAMRWNGEGDDPGYPSAFRNPIWFLLSDKLDLLIFRSLFGAESVDIQAIMAAIGGISDIASKKVGSPTPDVDEVKNCIGSHTVPIINIGNLIGKLLFQDQRLVIPITITPTSQDVFELDLKVLLEIVKNYSIPVTLKFKTGAGGGLVLPDWFIDACKQFGITIEGDGDFVDDYAIYALQGNREWFDMLPSLLNGEGRFGWSYVETANLNDLKKRIDEKGLDSLTNKEKDCYQHFLLDLKAGDHVIYTNIPERGKCTVAKVIGQYYWKFTDNDFNHRFPVDPFSIRIFDRSSVAENLRRQLSMRRRMRRIYLKDEFAELMENLCKASDERSSPLDNL